MVSRPASIRKRVVLPPPEGPTIARICFSGISDLILASRTAANRDASLVPMFLAGAIYLILIGICKPFLPKKVEKKYSYYR